jgi:hypothetical protein
MTAGLRVIVATLLALICSSVRVAAQPPTIEYDVKAAFLLNFARYVEWPPNLHPGQPFTLCTLSPDPFGQRLEAAAAGEQWNGQRIVIKRVTNVRDLSCHLLFVPAAATAAFIDEIDVIDMAPILTVGESGDFLKRGGMIQLFLDANRVRFSINQKAVEAARLRVSSRLLRLAREIVTSEVTE